MPVRRAKIKGDVEDEVDIEEEFPIPEGFWEERKVIYNLYHVLNHYVLFGGGYLSQAQSMMGQILMDDTR